VGKKTFLKKVFFPTFLFILFVYTNQKRKGAKMTRSDKMLIIICSVFIFIFGLLIFILPQKDFSESENRYLSRLPSFNANALISGNYAKGLSNFYTDQFPCRNIATSLYALCERSIGKKNVGGVICYNEQLIAIPEKQPTNKDIPIPAICVDSKYSLFKKQSTDLSLYYNTDHHRTTYGAYLLYLEACEKLNIKPYSESYFKKEKVSSNFYGTAFFKSRLPRFALTPDAIELWRYENDEDVTLTVHTSQMPTLGLYDLSKLNTADKYAVF
jgi:hypothetical protein